VYAQSLVEYGALGSIVAGLEQSALSVRTWMTSLSPTTWTIVGVVIVVILLVRRRRASR